MTMRYSHKETIWSYLMAPLTSRHVASKLLTRLRRAVSRWSSPNGANQLPAYGYLAGTVRWEDELLGTGEAWNADR